MAPVQTRISNVVSISRLSRENRSIASDIQTSKRGYSSQKDHKISAVTAVAVPPAGEAAGSSHVVRALRTTPPGGGVRLHLR